jgi:hypothetical protein
MLYCLVHRTPNGIKGHLFYCNNVVPDAGEVAAQLRVDFVLDDPLLEVAPIEKHPPLRIPGVPDVIGFDS